MVSEKWRFRVLVCIVFATFVFANEEPPVCLHDNDAKACSSPSKVPPGCQMVVAPSVIPESGWGLFTLVPKSRGQRVLNADIVIQVPDLNMTHVDGMILMLHDYMWRAEETGGFYEGIKVASCIPGVGSLANGLSDNYHNVLPFVPSVDEAGLIRTESPGAGAITHYHNFSFFVQKDITAGGEIFTNYGPGWFQERQSKLVPPLQGVEFKRSVDWLRENGRCVDNLKPGRSNIPHAGRGAFATRNLLAGSIVAPVPLAPITKREALDITRERADGTIVETKQLILNYCFGHPKSSVLFFPYGPLVGLVNHAAGKRANVKLQWSDSTLLHSRGMELLQTPIDEIKGNPKAGLMLEMVATRDIKQNEEILLDYGAEWVVAWAEHMKSWQSDPTAHGYAPGYVHDDAIKTLRTEAELKSHPYPDNIFTSCFYRYSDNKDKAEANKKQKGIVTYRWNMTRGIFELANLRPCNILKREHDAKGGTAFTVQIRNRYGLEENERLPKGAVHIVTHVPRHAIRLSDKIYTTDQHLPNAFRHEIRIPDELFPEQWKDLA